MPIPSKPGQKAPGSTGSYHTQKYGIPHQDGPRPAPPKNAVNEHAFIHPDRKAAVLAGKAGVADPVRGGHGANPPTSQRARAAAAMTAKLPSSKRR